VSEFFRFPRTPHLALLRGNEHIRDDKVLTPDERAQMLSGEVIVEEKLDGANVGLSVDGGGRLRARNRGSFIDPAHHHGQFRPLFRWIQEHRDALVEALSPHLVLFGEWCYAVHSIRYDTLPDWFLAFDVYDTQNEQFWSVNRRDALLANTSLARVPLVARGHFDLKALVSLLGRSKYSTAQAEGIYVRRDSGPCLQARAKLVRPEFVQAIDAHWAGRPLEVNRRTSD
jgi:ATP-dependent RNA circularization protein (DNA/RNA ligase family)